MKTFYARLGPGLLYAGAAVGVSHLVQSTRAGASYGLWMIIVVVVANLIKYPFFKAGPLYASQTGKSLLEAFHQQGKASMLLFYGLTFCTMFAVQAVVTLITASVLASILNLAYPLWQISAFLLVFCGGLLLLGHFRWLNGIMKNVILLLSITTLITLLSAVVSYQSPIEPQQLFSFFNQEDVFFLIALVGWMPAPLDISIWHSEWTLANSKEGNQTSLKDVIFDFKIGYWGTTFLAAAFVAMGSLLLRGKGAELPTNGVAFVGELMSMYTTTIGKWSFAFIAIAAFTTMFSTTLTVLDAYPRVLIKAISLSFPSIKRLQAYSFWLFVTIIGSLFVLIFQLQNMRQLVDFATTISFLAAPVLASMIFYAIRKQKEKIFSSFENYLALGGILFFIVFSLYYIMEK